MKIEVEVEVLDSLLARVSALEEQVGYACGTYDKFCENVSKVLKDGADGGTVEDSLEEYLYSHGYVTTEQLNKRLDNTFDEDYLLNDNLPVALLNIDWETIVSSSNLRDYLNEYYTDESYVDDQVRFLVNQDDLDNALDNIDGFVTPGDMDDAIDDSINNLDWDLILDDSRINKIIDDRLDALKEKIAKATINQLMVNLDDIMREVDE